MSSEKNKGKRASSSGTKDDKVGVNPLSTNAAQMLIEETERFTRLLQFYESLTEPSNAQGQQKATETELLARMHFLEQCMGEFREEVKHLIKVIKQVQETIKPRDEEQ